MAVYTVAELKDFTSIPAVSGFSDAKILKYQTVAESWLAGLNMDITVSGYVDAYNSAVLIAFDIVAENPTGLQSLSQGKVSKSFKADELPFPLSELLRPFLIGSGDGGVLCGAAFSRNNIGLR